MSRHLSTACFLSVLSLICVGLISPVSAIAKKRPRLRLEHYYVEEPMYLCSVKNRKTGQVFYGKSPKESFAKNYARSYCQMMSYAGQCFIKASCNHEMVSVRKRRFVPVDPS